MKKLLILALVVLMTATFAFAGCAKEEPTATTPQAATKAPEKTEKKAEATPESEGYEPMELSVFLATYAGQLLPGAKSFAEEAMEAVNVTIVWYEVDQSVVQEQAQVMIASQNILDIMAFPQGPMSEAAISLGVAVPLTDLIENSPAFNTIPESILNRYRHSNGEIYTTGLYTKDCSDMMYRKDWADALGLETPTNVDELYDFMLAFVQQDPDGNGVNDTAGFVFRKGWGLCGSLINAFIPSTFKSELGFHFDADGNMQHIFDDRDAWVKMLTWFQNAYTDGIFSEDFMQDSKASAETKFISGKAAMWPKNGIYIGSRLKTLRENFPEGEIVALPAIDCYMPEYGVNLNVPAGRGSSLYDPTVYLTTFCEDIERGKMFFEARDSWEGIQVWWFGKEGESYDMVDGKYVFKDEEYLSRINTGDMMANAWSYPLPFYRDVDADVEKAVQAITASADYVESTASYVQQSDAYLTYAADIITAIDEFLVEVCIGEKNPEDFDAFVQRLYDDFNLQTIIDEVTAAAE